MHLVDAVVGGVATSSADVLRAGLTFVGLLPGTRTVSIAGFVEPPILISLAIPPAIRAEAVPHVPIVIGTDPRTRAYCSLPSPLKQNTWPWNGSTLPASRCLTSSTASRNVVIGRVWATPRLSNQAPRARPRYARPPVAMSSSAT